MDIDEILKKVSDKTKIVFIANPNNPTGALYPKEILEGVIQIARKHKFVVFADDIGGSLFPFRDEGSLCCLSAAASHA